VKKESFITQKGFIFVVMVGCFGWLKIQLLRKKKKKKEY